jgi:hypothetical protein
MIILNECVVRKRYMEVRGQKREVKDMKIPIYSLHSLGI